MASSVRAVKAVVGVIVVDSVERFRKGEFDLDLLLKLYRRDDILITLSL